MYEVVEGVDTAVTVEIALQSGILGQEVEVRVFTVDDSAQGKRLLHKRKNCSLIAQLLEITFKSHSVLDSPKLQPASILL